MTELGRLGRGLGLLGMEVHSRGGHVKVKGLVKRLTGKCQVGSWALEPAMGEARKNRHDLHRITRAGPTWIPSWGPMPTQSHVQECSGQLYSEWP